MRYEAGDRFRRRHSMQTSSENGYCCTLKCFGWKMLNVLNSLLYYTRCDAGDWLDVAATESLWRASSAGRSMRGWNSAVGGLSILSTS